MTSSLRNVRAGKVLVGLSAAVTLIALAPRAARADGSSCVGGFDHAIFAKQTVALSGNTSTDSYDSTPPGTFATTQMDIGGNIGANGCSGPTAITVGGSSLVNGEASIGAGCSTSAGVSIGGSGAIGGAASAQTTNRLLPSVVVPTVGTNQGNKSASGKTSTLNLPANQTYGTVSIGSNATLVLNAGTYVMSSLTVGSNAVVTLASAPVTIYVTSELDTSGGAITNPSLVAANLVIMVASTVTTAKITGGTDSAFAIYAPDTAIQILGNTDIYGAIVGKTVSNSGNAKIHYDRAMAGYVAPGATCTGTTTEVSRSTPVIAYAGTTLSQFQGSYEVTVPSASPRTLAASATLAQAQAWTFPHRKGHVRAVPVGSISSSATLLSAVSQPVFDAATLIPSATNSWTGSGCTRFGSTCRTVFTNVSGGLRPTRTMVQSSNASSIGALFGVTLATARDEALKRIVGINAAGASAPALGGVDRSSMAVIEASPLSNEDRPVMAYVGGLDGMMHAICASVKGACTQVGMELWAFIPRTQLGWLKYNSARVNGTPRVAEVQLDPDGSGTLEWRTVLTFQTGGGDPTMANMTPAVYALDVTDPADPTIVWEYATPATRGTSELGVGLGLAMGKVQVSGGTRQITIAQTSNGGTGGAGTSVFAIDSADGSLVWRWDYIYPSARSVAVAVPKTGIPGGVAAADLDSAGRVTDVFVGTLYGNLFQLDGSTGANVYTGALYQFSTDYHPVGAAPTIYAVGGVPHVALASGGYADNSSVVGNGSSQVWSPATTNQYLIGISVGATVTGTPLAATSKTGKIEIAVDLGAGRRAGAQAQVSGDEIFVTSDTLNVNATSAYGTSSTQSGRVTRVALATGTVTSTTTVAGGASSVDVQSGAAFIAAGRSTQTVTAGTAEGESVEQASAEGVTRAMWLSN